MKLKFYNVALLSLAVVGLSGSFYALLFPKKSNVFQDIAPLSIVFSRSKNNTRVFHDVIFTFELDSGEQLKRPLDSFVYHFLPGPHRTKQFSLFILTKNFRFMHEPNYQKYLKTFCTADFSTEVLQVPNRIKAVSLMPIKASQPIVTVEC